MQSSTTNVEYTGASDRKSLYDLSIPESWNNKLIIFIHGYMGYKDWGCWNLVSDFFTNENYGFLKYNVSHNGGTIENAIDFPDLDAFSNNSYTKETLDLEAILDLVQNKFQSNPEIYLIGHSRGGGIALLQSTNSLIDKISTWAAISSIANRFPKGKELESWKNNGIYTKENGRTKQLMPHSYSQYKDFLDNEEKLTIEFSCNESNTPTLVVHGDDDQSVKIEEGNKIANWLNTPLIPIAGAQHTFGSKQPWFEKKLPEELLVVCKLTLQFFELEFKNSKREQKEKLSLMAELIKLANADLEVRDEEIQFLAAVSNQLKLNDEDFKKLINENIDFVPPKNDADRILQFQRLVLLINIDQKVTSSEKISIKNIGLKMGIVPDAIDEVLKRMNSNGGKALNSNELIDIFKSFLN